MSWRRIALSPSCYTSNFPPDVKPTCQMAVPPFPPRAVQKKLTRTAVRPQARVGRHSLSTECRPRHDHGAQLLVQLRAQRIASNSKATSSTSESRAMRAEEWLQASERSKMNPSVLSRRAGPSCRRCIELNTLRARGQVPSVAALLAGQPLPPVPLVLPRTFGAA